MPDDEKFLPCPFCGGTDLKHYDAIKIVECKTCKAGVKERWWNKRVEQQLKAFG